MVCSYIVILVCIDQTVAVQNGAAYGMTSIAGSSSQRPSGDPRSRATAVGEIHKDGERKQETLKSPLHVYRSEESGLVFKCRLVGTEDVEITVLVLDVEELNYMFTCEYAIPAGGHCQR